MANSYEHIKGYPQEVQRLVGYSVSKPFLGWVNLDDPLKILYGDDFAGDGMR